MYSMTGYGKGVASANGKTVTIEIKSVNHRYLDWGIKTPKNFLFLEDIIKKTVGGEISRGHVDVFVTYEQQAGSADEYVVNEELASKYLAAASKLCRASDEEGKRLADMIVLQSMLRQPDILVKQQVAEDPAKTEAELTSLTSEALSQAVVGLKEMRRKEGKALEADIACKLDNIAECLENIKLIAPEVVVAYREALNRRIAEALAPNEADMQRLATEVALFADRCCIDEEITRLSTHIANARALIVLDEPVGRRIEFLVQELNREANTIGSKANDLRVTEQVLAIKNEIEKLREQAANIE